MTSEMLARLDRVRRIVEKLEKAKGRAYTQEEMDMIRELRAEMRHMVQDTYGYAREL